MKNLFNITVLLIFLASCSSQKPLYSWGNYENTSYSYLKKKNAKGEKQLIEEYKKVTTKQKGSRNVAPPGMYADYGFLLLQAGDNAAGRALLTKEIAIYPEAKIFIDRILQMTASTISDSSNKSMPETAPANNTPKPSAPVKKTK